MQKFEYKILQGRDNEIGDEINKYVKYGYNTIFFMKVAEDKLKELQYPAEKIELIKKCILNHRGSQQNGRDSIEEQIIAEADVLSNFDNIAGIFKAAFIYENKTQGEAKDSVRQKLERKWKQLHFENSKKIIKPKYEAAMLLLK